MTSPLLLLLSTSVTYYSTYLDNEAGRLCSSQHNSSVSVSRMRVTLCAQTSARATTQHLSCSHSHYSNAASIAPQRRVLVPKDDAKRILHYSSGDVQPSAPAHSSTVPYHCFSSPPTSMLSTLGHSEPCALNHCAAAK
eukprot:1853-Heterococcus_DN1.PRE.2